MGLWNFQTEGYGSGLASGIGPSASFHAFLMCAATAGMRAGELRTLRWSDVYLSCGSKVVSRRRSSGRSWSSTVDA